MSSFCVEKNTRISGGFSLKLVFGFPSWPGDKQLSCFFFFFLLFQIILVVEWPFLMDCFVTRFCASFHFFFFFFNVVKNFSLLEKKIHKSEKLWEVTKIVRLCGLDCTFHSAPSVPQCKHHSQIFTFFFKMLSCCFGTLSEVVLLFFNLVRNTLTPVGLVV